MTVLRKTPITSRFYHFSTERRTSNICNARCIEVYSHGRWFSLTITLPATHNVRMSHVDPTLDGQADDEDVAFYTQHHEALEKGIKQHGIEYFTAKKDIHSTGLSNQGATCYLVRVK